MCTKIKSHNERKERIKRGRNDKHLYAWNYSERKNNKANTQKYSESLNLKLHDKNTRTTSQHITIAHWPPGNLLRISIRRWKENGKNVAYTDDEFIYFLV